MYKYTYAYRICRRVFTNVLYCLYRKLLGNNYSANMTILEKYIGGNELWVADYLV